MQLHILADDFSVCKVDNLSKINFATEYLFFSKTDYILLDKAKLAKAQEVLETAGYLFI